MRSAFGLINLVVGVLCLWVGVGNVEAMGQGPGNAVAGVVAIAMGAACLWLAEEATVDAPLAA